MLGAIVALFRSDLGGVRCEKIVGHLRRGLREVRLVGQ